MFVSIYIFLNSYISDLFKNNCSFKKNLYSTFSSFATLISLSAICILMCVCITSKKQNMKELLLNCVYHSAKACVLAKLSLD